MEQKRVFCSLTGLKGLFIWVIIWFHTAPDTTLFLAIPGNDFLSTYGGRFGNTMFFILSGVLLSWGYRDRILDRTVSFSYYFIRRLKKLYPSYFLSTLLMVAINIAEHGMSAINLKRIAFDLLLQSGGGLESTHPYNGPGWFVSALFVCYLLYYFIAYHAKNTTAYRCGIAAGIIWGYTLYCASWKIPFCDQQNGIAFLNFFIGCALAEIYPYIQQKRPQLLPAALLTLVISFWMLFRYGIEIIAGDISVSFAFIICPLIWYLAMESCVFKWILESKPVIWLGNISMNLYYWHFVIYVGYRYLLQLCNREIGNLEYLIYIVLLLLWCVIPAFKTEKKKHSRSA